LENKIENIVNGVYVYTATYHRVCGVKNGKAYITITKHIQNMSSEDLTVGEIGLVWTNFRLGSSTWGSGVLLAREVLPETVTIVPGESVAFSLTIEI
jgi:hypothetical protein